MSKSKENSLGVAAGIVGIVNVSLSFILSWFLSPLFVLSSIVVVVLSSVGLKRAKEDGTSAAWSVTGLATGIPTLVWNLLWTLLILLAAVSG